MKYQIRKCVTYTANEATQVISLDPKHFKKLKENPYTGDSEQEFLLYIKDFVERCGYDGCPDDLNEAAASEIIKLTEEAEYTQYANSAWKGEDSWFEIGEADEGYSRYGGFNSHFDTLT